MGLEGSDLALGKIEWAEFILLPLSRIYQVGLSHPDSAQLDRPRAIGISKGDNDNNVDKEIMFT